MENSYFDKLFTLSEEEKAVNEKIEAEITAYEATNEYKEHKEKMDSLYKERNDLMLERLRNAKIDRRRTVRENKDKAVDIDVLKAQIKERKENEYNSLPEGLRAQIKAFNELSDKDKEIFNKWTIYRNNRKLENYPNPQTKEEDIAELLHILVQECIEFINERGLKDIEEVHFSADSLQESAEHGTWCSSTDASCWVAGYGKEKTESGKDVAVRQFIGEYN